LGHPTKLGEPLAEMEFVFVRTF